MKNLSFKICLISLLTMFLSFACIGIYSITKADNALQGEAQTLISNSMHSIAEQLEAFNNEEFKMLETLAALGDIRSPDVPLIDKTHIIYDALATNPDYIDVCILDKNGNAYINNGAKMVSFAERYYFKIPFQTGQRFHTDPFVNKVTNAPAVFYSVPVFDFDGNIVNVIFSVIDGVRLSKEVTSLKIGNNRVAFLISINKDKSGEEEVYSELHSEGTMIATVNYLADDLPVESFAVDSLFARAKMLNIPEYYEKLQSLKTQESGIFTQNLMGNDYIVAYEKVPSSNWVVVNSLPFSDFQTDIKSLRFSVASFIILFAIVATVIIWIAVALYIKPLKKVKNAINEIATGSADLTRRLDNKSKDEVGEVVKGFNAFTEKLQSIVKDITLSKSSLVSIEGEIEDKAKVTYSAITDMKNDIENVKTEIDSQTSSVNKTVEAVNGVSSNIRDLDAMIESQATGVSQASAAIEEMMSNIASVNKTAEQLSTSFNNLLLASTDGIAKQKDVNEKVVEIEEQSKVLHEANKIIKDIAGQTNLLAMNAAIEAAHAGAAGAGFAVVADEIRKLAESSTTEANRIDKQLKAISTSIENVVKSSNESFSVLQNISGSIEITNDLVKQVSYAMEEQNAGSQQIGDALKTMNDTTVNVKSAGQNMSISNNMILGEIKNLQEATDKMNKSVQKLFAGTDKISIAGESLTEIIPTFKDTTTNISKQIDQFLV